VREAITAVSAQNSAVTWNAFRVELGMEVFSIFLIWRASDFADFLCGRCGGNSRNEMMRRGRGRGMMPGFVGDERYRCGITSLLVQSKSPHVKPTCGAPELRGEVKPESIFKRQMAPRGRRG
jgi:hypothetical protein